MNVTPELRAALDGIDQLLATVNREIAAINNPDDRPAAFMEAAARLSLVTASVSRDLATDLGNLHKALQDIAVPAGGLHDVPLAEVYMAALRDKIATARQLAVAAGFPAAEADVDIPPRLSAARAGLADELDGLRKVITGLAADIAGLRAALADDVAGDPKQITLVQYFIERIEVKLALIDFAQEKELIDILGLGEAVTGLLRLVRAFAETIRPAEARAGTWLRQRVAAMLSHAEALSTAFSRMVDKVKLSART